MKWDGRAPRLLGQEEQEEEEAPLIKTEYTEIVDRPQVSISRRLWNAKKGTIGSFALMLAVIAFLAPSRQGFFLDLSTGIEPENLIQSNQYERKVRRQIGNGVYKYDHLVSCYQETKFELKTKSVADWFLLPSSDSDSVHLGEGSEVYHTFTEIGDFKIKAVREDGEEFDFVVNCRITRYEIRDLSNEDQKRYFETLHKYYSISTDEGKALYGDTYVSWSEMVRMHLYGSADIECDHWHDGVGLLNHHIGLTFVFEQSIRMITPYVAAHYWDYTLDADKTSTTSSSDAWFDTNIFNDDWFGSNSPNNDDHIVDKGRWAFTKIMPDARSYSGITNPYGLLRSPWNTNPTPYLLRYDKTSLDHSLPSCRDFAAFVGESYESVSLAINGQLYGIVHAMIGGFWSLSSSSSSSIDSLGASSLLLSKILWRQGWLRVPESCSSDTAAEDCKASCPSQLIGLRSPQTVFEKAGISDQLPSISEIEDKLGVKEAQLLLEELCEVGYAGEMFTSSAPQDPIFWALHGNIERFIYALQYYHNLGEIDFHDHWSDNGDTLSSFQDQHLVCDWSGVETITDMPTCTHDSACSGHHSNDLLPFTNLQMVDGLKIHYYTNLEFYKTFTYQNQNLPYVYDSITYWKTCRSQSLLVEKRKI